jgi:hypothetical protein
MSTSEEYRKIAEDYERLAREAKTETDRLALLDLAETWFETASHHDEMSLDQIADAQKFAREWRSKPEKSKPQNPMRWWRRLLGVFRTDENGLIR